jgi:transposase
MRGREKKQATMFSTVSPEQRVPQDHPLRSIRIIADEALKTLGPTFRQMYSKTGRPSVPPERLLKSLVLIALYSVRSERQFCEQLDYNLLFRWFLDMDMDDPGFDPTTFGKNRERMMQHEVAAKFFDAVVSQARAAGLMSSEHFSVDGTLIEAWASLKSFRRKDDDDSDNNGWSDFKGDKRSNDTHESKTDPESKLFRKGEGREAKLCFMGHALMENRNALLVGFGVSAASGTAERDVALQLLDRQLKGYRRITLGADRGFDTRDCVQQLRARNVTPHIAQSEHRTPATDSRTTRHRGYAISIGARRQIEKILGWLKDIGGIRRTRLRGIAPTDFLAKLAATTYNMLRIANLRRAAA